MIEVNEVFILDGGHEYFLFDYYPKPLGVFLDIETAKEFSKVMTRTTWKPEGNSGERQISDIVFYPDLEDGNYIYGYIKYVNFGFHESVAWHNRKQGSAWDEAEKRHYPWVVIRRLPISQVPQ